MNAEIRGHGTVSADPDLALRLGRVAFHRVMEFDRADLKRFIAEKLLLYLRWKQMRQRTGDIGLGFEIVWRRRGWHRFLMLITRFRRLERGGHVKDRLAILNRRDTTRAKAVAIPQYLNVIHDGFRAITRA